MVYYRKNGYTQVKLAEQIGMSAANLGQIERWNRGNSFSLETLYQIADALEIDVNLLIKMKYCLEVIVQLLMRN
ncbi:helix-turn-helix domain-containing protein [Phascolarctobacterium sp.]